MIHVDIDPAEIGKNRAPDLPIVGDVKRVLERLNKIHGRRHAGTESRSTRPIARRGGHRCGRGRQEHPLAPSYSDTEIKPQHLMAEIDRLSGGQAIVCSDVGQHQMWAAQLIRFNEPRLWINSGGLGAMGFGVPSAIGAQFARPDKLVFAIVGDGGFQMAIPELSTIASNGLPVKIVVMNNGHLGMIRQWQELFYNNRLSSAELDTFPGRRKTRGRLRVQGTNDRQAARAGIGARSRGSRAGAVSAQRESFAVRERVSDDSGRRRSKRDGDGTAGAGGAHEVKELLCCK